MESEADDFSLIDGPSLDELLNSISGNGVTEQEKRLNQKYDSRKSLAWDTAFFNSAGVLDAEELSSLIEGSNRGRRQMLHLLDMSKSVDLLSNFRSDLARESWDSVQRSGGSSESRKSGSNRGMNRLSGTKSTALHGDMKSVSRKLYASPQGDGKLPKPRPVRDQAEKLKPWGSRREPQASFSKLAAASDVKGLRASATLSGRRMTVANVRNTMGSVISKAASPARSSSQSLTMRTGLSSTRYSYDSMGSSIRSSQILPRNGMQGKSDGNESTPPSSLRSRMPSKVPLKGKTHPRTSRITAQIPSPSASPTSSISACSSPSSAANVSKDISNVRRMGSFDSISYPDFQDNPIEKISEDHDHEVTGVPKIMADNRSTFNSISAKPSGLRMPTPTIGFFDGGKVKKVGMQSGLPASHFLNTTAIAVGNSNPNIQRSNTRLVPAGHVHERSTALMNPLNWKNVAAAKISDGGKSRGIELTIDKCDQVSDGLTDQKHVGEDSFGLIKETTNENYGQICAQMSAEQQECWLSGHVKETTDLGDKYSDSGKSNPGSRTPFADKNSMSNAYSVETLMKKFTSVSMDGMHGENVDA